MYEYRNITMCARLAFHTAYHTFTMFCKLTQKTQKERNMNCKPCEVIIGLELSIVVLQTVQKMRYL